MTLRLHRGLSKAEVKRRMDREFGQDPDRSTLYRAEEGIAWPKGDNLVPLLGVIGGSIEDLVWIWQHPNATAVEGYERAQKWISEHANGQNVAALNGARSRSDAEEIANDLEELARKVRGGLE